MKLSPSAMSDRDLIMEIGRGNPGALTVSCELLNNGRRDTLERMATLGIVGPRVWIIYSDMGHRKLEELVALVGAADIVQKLTELGYAPESTK